MASMTMSAKPMAAHTPASTRPRAGRTRPYRVAQPPVPGGGGGNPPGGGNPAPGGGNPARLQIVQLQPPQRHDRVPFVLLFGR